MAINYSTLLRLPKPDAGTQTWATYFHRLSDIMDKFAGDIATVTEKTGSKTLTDADGVADNAKALVIYSASVLTGNLSVVVPTRKRIYLVYNNTTGSFTMQVKTSGGTGATVKQGRFQWVWCDGTNVVPISRLSGQATVTELGAGILTATTAVIGTGAITAAMLAANAVSLSKFGLATSGSGSFRYSATSAGNPFVDLLKGTARQGLVMSTGVVAKPSWKTLPFRDVATSTNIAIVASSLVSYTHGLGGIAAITDIKKVSIQLVCLSTDLGYSAGDMAELFGGDSAGSNTGIHALVDSLTVVKANIGSNYQLLNKSTNAKGFITFSKWGLLFRVYA